MAKWIHEWMNFKHSKWSIACWVPVFTDWLCSRSCGQVSYLWASISWSAQRALNITSKSFLAQSTLFQEVCEKQSFPSIWKIVLPTKSERQFCKCHRSSSIFFFLSAVLSACSQQFPVKSFQQYDFRTVVCWGLQREREDPDKLMAMRNFKQIHIISSETFNNRNLANVENVGGTHTLLKMTKSGCRFPQPIANLTTTFMFHWLGFKKLCPFCLGKDSGET